MTLIMSDAAWEAMVGGRWVAKWDARLIFFDLQNKDGDIKQKKPQVFEF